jgi:hypothetical protein
MDPSGLAAAVTILVTSSLAKTGEKPPEPVADLWKAITEKFAGTPAAEEAANDLVKAPLEEDNQAAFRKALRKAMSDDDGFVKQVLVRFQAAHAGSSEINFADTIVNLENSFGTIQFGAANVQNIGTQINDSTVGGDVTGGDKITSGQ